MTTAYDSMCVKSTLPGGYYNEKKSQKKLVKDRLLENLENSIEAVGLCQKQKGIAFLITNAYTRITTSAAHSSLCLLCPVIRGVVVSERRVWICVRTIISDL